MVLQPVLVQIYLGAGGLACFYWVFLFFLQGLFIRKGKSISKVLCIFSRCEVFITAFCTAICKLDIFGIFLDSTVSLAHAC